MALPGLAAIAVILALFNVSRQPPNFDGNIKKVAAPYKFVQMPIALPPGYHPTQTIRQVNPAY